MLSINNLSLQYGAKHIFRNISAQVHSGERIGLVGVNGTGKSTLLKIMAGIQEVDPGIVSRAAWFTVAYLPQEIALELGEKTRRRLCSRATSRTFRRPVMFTRHASCGFSSPTAERIAAM